MAFLMLFGTFVSLGASPVYADGDTTAAATGTPATGTPATGAEGTGEGDGIDYMNRYYETAEQKLADMELKLSAFGYELYYENYTGEVAYRNTETGQILFTNPYDVAMCGGGQTDDTKSMLLSQLVVNYTENDREYTFYSYTEAALREQIKFKYIKNGIRVEYTIGREESRLLCPYMLTKERFENDILPYITSERDYNFVYYFYQLKDPNDPELTELQLQQMYAQYPITKKGIAVYILDGTATDRETNKIESNIKYYCPHFTYQVLEEAHAEVEYESTQKDPANFKMSLEYTINQNGSLEVRLPANGITFNETRYKLNYIDILPYMGAGSTECGGFTWIPDGSGASIEYDAITKPLNISGSLYGSDYAYQTAGGGKAQVMRMPLFAVVEHYSHIMGSTNIADGSTDATPTTPSDGSTDAAPTTPADESKAAVTPATGVDGEETGVEIKQDRGFVAIIEEGDALASITSSHGGNATHKYNSVYTTFSPRPKDTYTLSSSDTGGSTASWTVVSKRKYTGSYKLNVTMLSDEKDKDKCVNTRYYECNENGIAKVYRDYLENAGLITRLTDSDVSDQIPIYIRTFGMIEVDSNFLSFPTTEEKPITTIDDIKNMYSYLSENGVKNVVFRLDGYANGGMVPTVPYHVDFEKTVGGNDGLRQLLDMAAESGFEVYPEFDFAYVHNTGFMDGLSYKRDIVKSMDGRYTFKTLYTSPLNCISPSVFKKIYASFDSEYSEIIGDRKSGLSVSTLGTDLNSDFDKKDPYNREDSKAQVKEVLERMSEKYDIMIEGGNAYATTYATHIINAPIDSSRYTAAARATAVFGMVYHGYVNFAGTPTNMAGNVDYEVLKMIENGAYPYFILSVQNTSELKNNPDLSAYYSIRFDIWKEDLVEIYNRVNDVLADLQTVRIDGYEYMSAYRIPTDREIAYDEYIANLAKEEEEALAKLAAEKAALMAKLEQRRGGVVTEETEEELEDEIEKIEDLENAEIAKTDKDKYLIDDGSIVSVTYEDGTVFILNYNDFDVTVSDGEITVPAMSYVIG